MFDTTTPIRVKGVIAEVHFANPHSSIFVDATSRVPWWGNWDKVITGRLLVLKSGPAEHWSHYGPLDACQALLESQ